VSYEVEASYENNVVDFEQQNDGFGGEIEGRGVDEHGLNNAVVAGRGNAAALDIDAGSSVAGGVAGAEGGDELDRIEAGVLGQRVGNKLERIGVGAGAVGVEAGQRARPLGQPQRDLDLGRAAARRQAPALDQRAHHAQRIVERALGLGQHQAIGAAHQHAHGPHARLVGRRRRLRVACRVLADARDAHDRSARRRLLLHQRRSAQLACAQALHRCDWLAAHVLRRPSRQHVAPQLPLRSPLAYLANQFDIAAFDVRHNHNLHFREKRQRQCRRCVAQNRLLNQQNVGANLERITGGETERVINTSQLNIVVVVVVANFLDFFAQIQQIASFFFLR
jgi:hypothetical protein